MQWNLADLFECVVDAVPGREAAVCGERRLTYRDLDERANRLGHHLASLGIGKDDHVALYLYNGTEYLEAMIACFKIRAVPVNVNYRYVDAELSYLFDDADAKAVIHHEELDARVRLVAPKLPHLAVDRDYEDALAAASPERDFPPRSLDDIYILYTGGTTGMPKGVLWRHEDIFFASFTGLMPAAPKSPEGIGEIAAQGAIRILPASPFMHGGAHWLAFAGFYAGATVVVSPDRRFDAARLLELIARERVTHVQIIGDAFAVPMADALPRADLDLSSFTGLITGGAITSASSKRRLIEHVPHLIIADTYGASESGGQGRMISVAGAEISQEPRFVVNEETTVLDELLEPIAPGSGVVGKLARRGHVPLGYYKDPAKTASTFPVVHGVRWSIPGDDATVDADGTIVLLGRGSVSINTGGEKVYPEEVEAALKDHPDVFDAVVIGVPDERWGERVVAIVQTRAGAAVAFEDIDARVRKLVAGYKAPRQVVFVDEIERSPSGKADYRWAKALAKKSVTK